MPKLKPKELPLSRPPARETTTDKKWLDMPFSTFTVPNTSPRPIRSRRDLLQDISLEWISRCRESNDSIESIANFVATSSKGMWDGDPETLVRLTKAWCRDFFTSHPRYPKTAEKASQLVWEKAIVGRLLKIWFRGGKSVHGKPKLRK
jgi:hypothetical protein